MRYITSTEAGTVKRRRANGMGSIRKIRSRWHLRLSGPNGRYEIPTKARTRSEALQILGDRLSEMRRGRYDPEAERTRVIDLYEDLGQEYNLTGKRVDSLEWRWKHLKDRFGADLAKDVTSPRLRRYATERLDEGASGATVNRELGVLRRMFRFGASADPPRVLRVPGFPMLRESNPRMSFFERKELEAVRSYLPHHLRPFVTIAYWLGWRKSELMNLEWRHVDLERGSIHLDPGTTKNGDGRLVYLPGEARSVLRAWRDETSQLERQKGIIVRWVFHRNGDQLRDFYVSWRNACTLAGLPGKRLHDFRRTAARLYIRSGTPERVAMDVLGHRTRSIFDRYNITSENDLREAAGRVDRESVGEALGKNRGTTPDTS